jgi:membrane fusion protein (multidrug efflux system)
MPLGAQGRDRGEQSQLGLPQPPSQRGSFLAPGDNRQPSSDAAEDATRSRVPARAIVESPKREDQDRKQEAEPRASLFRRLSFASATVALLFILVAVGGYLYWDYAEHFESTDDAFIAARQFAIAPEVSGYITAVPVTDNQHVAVGAVVARIDDRDYRIALEKAQAQVASAAANIQVIDAEISEQQAQISANQSQMDQAQAAMVFAQQQATRYQELAQRGTGSVQDAQQYTSQLRQREDALASAKATLILAQRQIEALKAQRASAAASLEQAKAQCDQAQLNLSYTTVRADQAGRIANLSAAVGEFAQPGLSLTMFVPDEIWVTANFKETQLDQIRPGQPVMLKIDAYPERIIRGHIASVQPGSGPAFSLLPPENATGNYVKIVQRVPVKIIIDNPPADVVLGPGMSVVPTVRVNAQPSLYERLKGWL